MDPTLTDTIDMRGDPLAFLLRPRSAAPLRSGRGVIKVEARQMAGHQKEAVVAEGADGHAWRLTSDEGLLSIWKDIRQSVPLPGEQVTHFPFAGSHRAKPRLNSTVCGAFALSSSSCVILGRSRGTRPASSAGPGSEWSVISGPSMTSCARIWPGTKSAGSTGARQGPPGPPGQPVQTRVLALESKPPAKDRVCGRNT
jgi:hypothetical protein